MNQDTVRKLYRSRNDRMISGVSAGIGKHSGVDPTIIRLLWVIAALTTGPAAVIAYVVLAVITPVEPASQ